MDYSITEDLNYIVTITFINIVKSHYQLKKLENILWRESPSDIVWLRLILSESSLHFGDWLFKMYMAELLLI